MSMEIRTTLGRARRLTRRRRRRRARGAAPRGGRVVLRRGGRHRSGFIGCVIRGPGAIKLQTGLDLRTERVGRCERGQRPAPRPRPRRGSPPPARGPPRACPARSASGPRSCTSASASASAARPIPGRGNCAGGQRPRQDGSRPGIARTAGGAAAMVSTASASRPMNRSSITTRLVASGSSGARARSWRRKRSPSSCRSRLTEGGGHACRVTPLVELMLVEAHGTR